MIPASDKKIAYSLRDLVSRLNRSLRKQAGNNTQLSIAEENVIWALLTHDEALPSELCTQLDISSQFMSQILKRLEKLGYISRKPSKADKRKSLVSLTKKLKLTVEKNRKQKEDWLASLISEKFNKQQKELIAQAISLLTNLY